MPKRRPTNNVARLPRETRYRVYTLILDGRTYEEIRGVTGISNLHNTSLIACQRSAEFLDYRAATAEYQAKTLKQSIEAAVVREGSDLSVLAEEGLRGKIEDLLSNGDLSDPKAVKALTSSLRDLAAMKEARKVKAMEADLAAQKVYFEGVIAEKEAEIERLTAALAVKKETGKRGLSDDALAAMEEESKTL